ncbi:DUF3592 domain-containing protein [Marinomonas sp. 15G1-11]|uniref:DUF3592 domain-containing protein n=1 Tax=Marinomonas phaeophyticola TaxID=3004091 RepID=A0ABT4JQ57_9GAMM|nr:DUF3592 domain-containing protein [Marinomonas sp. 15G1-11]MCZ2720493.1 DUF3592 domain-containing protein [Marinomonas sp. 15G1-11]
MIDYVQSMWMLASDGDKQGVLFFVVIYAFVICLYSSIQQILIRSWPTTKGHLLTASIKQRSTPELIDTNQEYKVNSLYVYQVSDKVYQGKRVSPWLIIASHNAKFLLKAQLKSIQNNEDGTVNVFFNPKKPQKSYLVQPGGLGIAITLAMAILPIVFYSLAYL